MSYLAIGAVTKAMAELLFKKLNKPPLMGTSTTFRVTTLPPDDERVGEEPGINLFLYRLIENPHLKNMNWVGDRANLQGATRPPLALTLNYLLTAYAKKVTGSAQDDITAHQLLGNAMAILHDHPVLNDVHDSDFDADLDAQFAPELRQSFEKVKISLVPISLEDFSKIWTGLTKAYRLSVAYEVSLVQIAPLVPTPLPRPPVQRTMVAATTVGPPAIVSVTPAAGPAGAQVTLGGSRFLGAGRTTSVTVGGMTLAQTDLVRISREEIVLAIPEAPQRGPDLSITVTVGGLESNLVTYEVRPWIGIVQPLRGITGIPITVPFEIPTGASINAEIDGRAATVTLDPMQQQVRAVVPTAIATNGLKPVVLILDGGTPQRSNALFYEVLPAIQSFTAITAPSPARTTVTVSGERLRGKDVHLRYGALLARVGENTNDAQVTFQFDRVLPATGPVSLLVDGRETNSLPRHLERVEPPQAAVGDTVTLLGSGLSGRTVTVKFGTTTVSIGPQPFASQFAVAVPGGLAPGALTVRVTVDGTDTNTVPFTVVT